MLMGPLFLIAAINAEIMWVPGTGDVRFGEYIRRDDLLGPDFTVTD
jgi:hypothetical protein